ncbi:MAG TPA: hypothetical protein VGT44_09720, partial [Ktedonobacteraceae bacterium]|nr:hypothetical protein [Ktedonobacteraceae bacterium]
REFIASDERERARLIREGKPLQQQRTWPRAYSVFEDAERGRIYLLMDYIPGLSLDNLRRTLPSPATSQFTPRPPSAGSRIEAMTPIPLPVRRRVAGTKKREKILFFALALLIGAVFSVSLFMFFIKSPLTHTATPRATSTPRAIPASTLIHRTSFYLVLATAYAGTVVDLLNDEKTAMYLMGLQQNQGRLSGLFQGLGLAGPIAGTVTSSGHVRFKLSVISNDITLVFDGDIKIGGDIAGSFVALNQLGNNTGESGIWNIAAIP